MYVCVQVHVYGPVCMLMCEGMGVRVISEVNLGYQTSLATVFTTGPLAVPAMPPTLD